MTLRPAALLLTSLAISACGGEKAPLAESESAVCGKTGCPPPCNTSCTPAAGCSAACTDTTQLGQPVVTCGAFNLASCLPACFDRTTCAAADQCSKPCWDGRFDLPSTCGRTGRACATACGTICTPASACTTPCVGPGRDSCGEHAENGVLQCMPCSQCIASTAQQCANGAELSSCDAGDAGNQLPPGPPTFAVETLQQLVDAIEGGPEGANIVVRADIDLGDERSMTLKAGVTLAGDRGRLGRGPRLFTHNKELNAPLFILRHPNTRITGLRLEGPSATTQMEINGRKVEGKGIRILGQSAARVDNCELYNFPDYAVEVIDVAPTPELIDPLNRVLFPRIHDNYIHHNQKDESGYGVVVSHGGYAAIEQNTFNNNRHSIASGGQGGTGYFSRKNYFLSQINPEYWDWYYGQHMDVHGTLDNGHGGIAGEYFEISHNTVLGAQGSLEFIRAAFKIRGTPQDRVDFFGNVVEQHEEDAVAVYCGLTNTCDPIIQKWSNEYAVDRSTDMAVGDFDGDRRSDVFQATGATWQVSWGGVTEWRFLNFPAESAVRRQTTGDLAFADVNNDGRTDVVARYDGRLLFSPGGMGPLEELTAAPAVPLQEIRFGDFDGDRATDLFITAGGQWLIWRATSGVFQPAASSSLPISRLRFGEFDQVPGTDVIAVTSGALSISSGATGAWAPINSEILASLAGTVVADVNGDGRDDLAWSEGRDWYVSYGGRSAPELLQSPAEARERGLDELLIGTFDAARGADALFYLPVLEAGRVRYDAHFGLSSGLRQPFVSFSREEMR